MSDSSLGGAVGAGMGDMSMHSGDGSMEEALVIGEQGGVTESHVPLVKRQAGREGGIEGEGERVMGQDRERARVVRRDPSRDLSPKRMVSNTLLNERH